MLVQGLAENLQRQNLTDLEQAEGVGRLFEELGGKVDREPGEHSPATKKTAELLGFSSKTISEFLRLYSLTTRTKFQLNKTQPTINRRVITAALGMGGEDAVTSMATLPVHTMIDLQH